MSWCVLLLIDFEKYRRKIMPKIEIITIYSITHWIIKWIVNFFTFKNICSSYWIPFPHASSDRKGNLKTLTEGCIKKWLNYKYNDLSIQPFTKQYIYAFVFVCLYLSITYSSIVCLPVEVSMFLAIDSFLSTHSLYLSVSSYLNLFKLIITSFYYFLLNLQELPQRSKIVKGSADFFSSVLQHLQK